MGTQKALRTVIQLEELQDPRNTMSTQPQGYDIYQNMKPSYSTVSKYAVIQSRGSWISDHKVSNDAVVQESVNEAE